MTDLPHPERRAALVTGASSGIGEAIARRLAALGHPVVLAARRVERCDEYAQKIRADGGEAYGLSLDLASNESIDAFSDAALAAVGPAEIVVSAAGDVLPASAIDTDSEAFTHQVQINLLGVHRLVTRIAPGMVERRRGDIVFVTSDVVERPRPFMASYMTSKWGLEGMATAMRMELEGTGVRASVVRPGPTLTEMGMTWAPEVVNPLLKTWKKWGLVRHGGYLDADGVASAVMAIVTAPRGTHLTMIEVEPEAPIRDDLTEGHGT